MTTKFEAVEHDEGKETTLGVVTVGPQEVLTVVSADPGGAERLQTIVDELNGETTLHQEAAPPAGARPFELFTRPVRRGSPDFMAALMEHLQRYHDIELRPR